MIALQFESEIPITPEFMLAALPDSVRVAGFDFTIERRHVFESQSLNQWGSFSSIEQKIYIQEVMPSCAKLIDTFWHEISHAIEWAYGIEDGDKEERRVSIYGTAIMTLFRDNPWLAGWLGYFK